jgi:multidrug resistance efflux pump
MDESIQEVTGHPRLLSDLRSNNHLRSEMAQEIISRKPSFLEKWALFIFCGILLLLLLATWFIKYPEVIEAHATLTAANAPKEIIPRQEGRLVKLFVHNNEKISKGEPIGWIESAADYKEVMALSTALDSCIDWLSSSQFMKVTRSFAYQYSNLGELQQEYKQFIVAWQQFNDYMVNGFYARKRGLLLSDITALDAMEQRIRAKKQLTEQDIELAQETYNMNSLLLDEKVLSKEEFRKEKSKFVNKKMSIHELEASLIQNTTQRREKLKEIEQLDHDKAQQMTLFVQSLQSMRSTVDEWKKKYMLQSPIDGRVYFTAAIQENQFLQQGRLLGYVIPQDSRFFLESYLPQRDFGKIDTGLAVQVRFDAYPYQEAGPVDGTLSYVSNIATDSGFLATIRLDNGLVTKNNLAIPYRSGLKAQAVIITRNMRLIDKFYYNIIKSTSVGSKK